MSKNNNLTLFLLISITVSFTFFSKTLLKLDDVLLNSLFEEYSYNQVEEIIQFKQKWQWISYAVIPLIILLKTSIIAAILDLGCFLFGKEIKYKKLFNIVVKAEFVFLLVIIAKTAWFYFPPPSFFTENC